MTLKSILSVTKFTNEVPGTKKYAFFFAVIALKDIPISNLKYY